MNNNTNDVSAKCLNGILKVGDLVISTPDDEYGCLIGSVMQINLVGSTAHEIETSNETDDIHVNFHEYEYSEKRSAEIAEHFSVLYGEKKEIDECLIDDVIMSPGCLIRITGINEGCLNGLLESGYNAACYCYNVKRRFIIGTNDEIKYNDFS